MLSVVIGRFQTPYLHSGHKELFEEAKKHSNRILVLIGVSSASGTDKNPLSYEMRREMIDMSIPKDVMLITKPLHDCPLSDDDWSEQIDELVEECGDSEAIIFGGRDNSIQGYYSGKHKTHIIEGLTQDSATRLRKQIANQPAIYGHAARSAIIHHVETRYPIVYSTVDIAILKYYGPMIGVLMGKKGDKFNFIGGFVDPADNDLQSAAERELLEETGISKKLTYEFSTKINDPRYKGTKDSIMTHLFSASVHYHYPAPDLSTVKDKEFDKLDWLELTPTAVSLVANHHQELFLKLTNLKK